MGKRMTNSAAAVCAVAALLTVDVRAQAPQSWIGPASTDSGPFVLTLGETRFDPGVAVPRPPRGWDTSHDDAFGRNLGLIQFDGPIREAWLDAIAAMDVQLVQYVHPYTYVTWSNEAGRLAAAQLPHVRWTGDFHPAYRVLPPYRNLDTDVADLRVMLYRGADCDAAVAELVQLGGQVTHRAPLDQTFEIVRLHLPAETLAEAARLAGVYSIKPVPTDGGSRGEMTNQIVAGNVSPANIASPGYAIWLSSIGLDGSNVIMANVDEGVQETHPDLASRMLPCTGTSCSTAASNHGTHTAGIMAGDGSSGATANGGFLRGLGVAPGATLIEQDYRSHFSDPTGMLLLMTESHRNGALLSNNSWGPAGTPRGYDDDTRAIDVGVRDADPTAPGNQSLTYVLAFMNGYGGTSSQGTPDEAKNLFNIGSTKAQTSSGSQNASINDLSSNSAHGPALDGRTIPHMVAPGCYVDSSIFGSGFGLDCGTSMAAPHVAGAAALFIEYYRSRPGFATDPSPALVKAAFLPVCHDLAGKRDADGGVLSHPFDSKQGWGRINLDAVVNPDPGSVLYFDNPSTFGDTGEQWSVDVEPADPSKPIRIMLVWTDAPGHGLGGSTPAWNNNLDLVVDAGATYRGNQFDGNGYSAPSATPDNMNNTEGVFLGPTPPAAATITVLAANINSDGVPGNADTTDQDFALVCYNCIEPVQCAADIAGPNGAVDVFDLLELLSHWGADGPGASIATPNDVVDVFDLLGLLDAWGDC